MKEPMKNIAKAEVLTLKEQIDYQKGQVVSKTLAQNSAVSVTLFSFDKGEEISTHESEGDAFVTCLDGMETITIDGTDMNCVLDNPLSCLPDILMRYMEKSSSKCFLSSYFEKSTNYGGKNGESNVLFSM